MEVSKIEDSFNKLFTSMYGETLLLGNSVKLRYKGLSDTLVSPGGITSLLPEFEFISTNKSFTYGFVFSKINIMCDKIKRYLGINANNVIISPQLSLSPIYLTEDDEKYINKTFMELNKLTMISSGLSETVVGHLDVKPLSVFFEFDKGGENTIHFNFNFFIVGGEIEMRNGEIVTLPTHKDNDYILEEYIKFNLECIEINNITDSLVSRILVDEPIDSVNTYLNPTF